MMSIREKLVGSIAVLLVLACTIGGVALLRFDTLSGISREITGNWMPSIEALGRITSFTQRHRALVALHILNTDDGRMAQIDGDILGEIRDLEAARDTYRKLISSAEEQAIYAEFGRAWSGYLQIVAPILAHSRKNENAEATRLLQDRAWPAFHASRQALDRLVALNARGGQAATAEADRIEASGRTLILAFLGGGVLLCVGVGAWIVRGVRRDIDALAAPMARLATGDLAADIPRLPARTEMGEMAQALGALAAGLRDAALLRADQDAAKQRAEQERKAALAGMADGLENQVGSVIQGIASAATELTSAATSMVQIAEEASQQAATVNTATAAANGDVDSVAAASEELATSVAEISRQVAESARMATAAVEQSGRADTTVANLTDAAARIGEVTRLIGDIAAQTNLLALNATIEAARAGDAGKGFAVVASEVKTLASQTAKATESISGQIAAMQDATEDAARDLSTIRESIGRINEVTSAIAAAVEQQGAATRDIAQSVQRAAGGTREIAGAIGTVSAAAGETSGAAGQVQATAETLSSQAELLRRQVGDFLHQVRAA